MAEEQEPSAVLASIESIASSLSATQEALADCLDLAVARRNASHRDASLPHPALRAVSEVALLLETSHSRLMDAVKTIPAKAEYGPLAARLRQAAAAHPEVEAILRQAVRELAAPLANCVPVMMQTAADLQQARNRLLETGSGLRLVANGGAPTAAPSASATPALQAALERMEALEGRLAAHTAAVGTISAATAEAQAAAASLRGVQAVAAPLVDTLSDLAHLVAPLSEKLRVLAEAPAAATPPVAAARAGTLEGLADWANDIARSVAELRDGLAHISPTGGDPDRRLWENVRRLQTEVVNLQATLLSMPKKPLPDDRYL
jgi:hypothetical protein